MRTMTFPAHCAKCHRPRHLGIGQPAPAETGRLGRTYRLRHDGLMSA